MYIQIKSLPLMAIYSNLSLGVSMFSHLSSYSLRLVACLFLLSSFNAKAIVINGCTIEPNTVCIGTNLTGVDLSSANLSGAGLFGVKLRNASLYNANLSGAWIEGADLRGADLRNANLENVGISVSNMAFADLSGTSLTGAIFLSTYLVGANLQSETLFAADLRSAIYNDQTLFPADFDPVAAGMIIGDATFVPLPAGIYLFLSGLVGLGLMRGRGSK